MADKGVVGSAAVQPSWCKTCKLSWLTLGRAFSKQEAERHGLQPYFKSNLGSLLVLPGVGEFEDGYELKWVSMRNVILDDAGPSVEELTRFNQVLLLGQNV